MEALERLPERVSALELQMVQLREEMHDGFSELRGEIGKSIDHASQLNRQTIEVVEMLHAETNRNLGEQIAEARRHTSVLFEEARRHTSVLFEEVISRIERLDERRSPKKRRS